MNSSKVIDQRQQVIILEKARQDLETLREYIFSRLIKELQVTDLWKLLQTYSLGCMSMLTATVFKFCVSRTLSTPDEINAMLLQLSDSFFKVAADQYAQCLQHSRSNFMQWSRKSHLHRLETKLQLRQSDNKRSKHLPYELHCLVANNYLSQCSGWKKHRKVVMVNEEFLRPQPCTATRATKEPLGKTARAAHQEIQAHKRNGGFQQVYCGLCHCFQISLNSA
ncbi:BnaC02g17590D [Brassica napus]|nr:BnaC02g17590D [Brassica napus]